LTGRLALHCAIAASYEYFLIERAAAAVGYAAVLCERDERRLLLSKLYVRSSVRLGGIARFALTELENLGKERGLQQIYLTVNKQNPAVEPYLRMGFVDKGPVVADIGGDFLMDDYRMAKAIV
jgi:diamine N-acetyltransferase